MVVLRVRSPGWAVPKCPTFPPFGSGVAENKRFARYVESGSGARRCAFGGSDWACRVGMPWSFPVARCLSAVQVRRAVSPPFLPSRQSDWAIVEWHHFSPDRFITFSIVVTALAHRP